MFRPQVLITNQIRRLRFENGEMTQEQLALAVGVSRQTIVALEACKYVPSLLLAMKIAKLFSKGVEEVFRVED
jgi:putative transcriptional regulator